VVVELSGDTLHHAVLTNRRAAGSHVPDR
jgi:hypothetical protein